MALKCSSPNHWVWLGLVTGMGLRREDRTVSQTVDCVTPTRKGASFLSSHGVSCVLSLGFFLFVTQSCAELWFWDRIGCFKPRVQRYSSKLGFFFFFSFVLATFISLWAKHLTKITQKSNHLFIYFGSIPAPGFLKVSMCSELAPCPLVKHPDTDMCNYTVHTEVN